MLTLLRLLLATLPAVVRRRHELLLENLLLRQQLQVALRSQRRPQLRTGDKLFWLIVRRLHGDWRPHLILVRPETVIRWHRQGWRLYWRWRSRPRVGRPRLSPVSFQTLYVCFFISHGRRQLLHFQVTGHPTAAWVWRQLIEATAWGRQPIYLIHDRDRVYGAGFATRAAAIGIKSLRTPIQAPNANSVGERVVRTLHRECIDHLIILGEQHLRSVLAEFVVYYKQDRPHRALGLETPVPSSRRLRSRPVLGGLHHVYERAA